MNQGRECNGDKAWTIGTAEEEIFAYLFLETVLEEGGIIWVKKRRWSGAEWGGTTVDNEDSE